MAAFQNHTFAHNSKTKHDRKAKSKTIPRLLGSANPVELFSEFKMVATLDFQDGHHANLILPITRKLNMIERQTQRLHIGFWGQWPPFKT